MKRIVEGKWIRFPFRNPLQLQAWLEDLSLEGWKLEKVGGEYGVFQRVEPHRIRYRMEPVEGLWEDKPLGYYEEKERLYEEMGWRRLGKTSLDLCYLYCAEDPDAPELHTDADILKLLWRRTLRRSILWSLLWLGIFLFRLLTLLNDLFGGIGASTASSSLVSISINQVISAGFMGIVFLVSLWYGWEQCAPYRQLRRGDSEPCRPYPTGGWRWWRRRIAYVLIGLLALVPLGSLLGVWSTMNQRIDAYPSNYFAYDLYSLPEHRELPYIDLAGLDYRGTLNDRVSYWERANTFTTIYASNVTQSTEVYSLPLQYLTTDYYHMRSAYFADLLQEKLLLGATGIESMLLPEVDEALRGRDEDNNPFLLVRRGNRMIYFECSEGLVDLYAQAEAVVDLLDQAAY